MKTVEKKVYYCDFCTKHMLVTGPMKRHETFCQNNPNNKHKCFDDCKHLVKSDEVYDAGLEYIDGVGEVEIQSKRKVFSCAKTGQKMYSFWAEKKDIVKHLKDTVRMPLECDMHEDNLFE